MMFNLNLASMHISGRCVEMMSLNTSLNGSIIGSIYL